MAEIPPPILPIDPLTAILTGVLAADRLLGGPINKVSDKIMENIPGFGSFFGKKKIRTTPPTPAWLGGQSLNTILGNFGVSPIETTGKAWETSPYKNILQPSFNLLNTSEFRMKPQDTDDIIKAIQSELQGKDLVSLVKEQELQSLKSRASSLSPTINGRTNRELEGIRNQIFALENPRPEVLTGKAAVMQRNREEAMAGNLKRNVILDVFNRIVGKKVATKLAISPVPPEQLPQQPTVQPPQLPQPTPPQPSVPASPEPSLPSPSQPAPSSPSSPSEPSSPQGRGGRVRPRIPQFRGRRPIPGVEGFDIYRNLGGLTPFPLVSTNRAIASIGTPMYRDPTRTQANVPLNPYESEIRRLTQLLRGGLL